MKFFNKFFNSNYYLSYILSGISIYLYFNKINYKSIKKSIQNKINYYCENITIYTNDSIDNSLYIEQQKSEKNYCHDKDEFNYLYYCNNNI